MFWFFNFINSFKLQTQNGDFLKTTKTGIITVSGWLEGTNFELEDKGGHVNIKTNKDHALENSNFLILEKPYHDGINQRFTIKNDIKENFISIIFKTEKEKRCFTVENMHVSLLKTCSGNTEQLFKKIYENPDDRKIKILTPLQIKEEELIRREEELQKFKDNKLIKKENVLKQEEEHHQNIEHSGCNENDNSNCFKYKSYKNPKFIDN
ncbi:hypothetical protein EHP00_1166 [Ecytonucleospora hepatopenaei]|uniref:Uncharacterized protein n=1 Tax=Ecytonucleospora hepatopenaei TaxID=646526 RepID=A0A1W0E4E3_9MICR|nr:hypothetical protein EHP00_1166 [Ecytonucleospora hepatopenaei]